MRMEGEKIRKLRGLYANFSLGNARSMPLSTQIDFKEKLSVLTIRQLSQGSIEKNQISEKRGYTIPSFNLLKTKCKAKKLEHKKMCRATMKSDAIENSFIDRISHLAFNQKYLRELSIHIIVILMDGETNRNEVLTFEFNVCDKISVGKLVNKIPLHASDPLLGNRSYQCICLENAFVLEKSKSIQSYFSPSIEKQFVIAVPTRKTCAELVQLARPIIHKIRILSPTNIKRSTGNPNRVSITSTYNMKTSSTPVNAKDIVYMVMAIMLIFMIHGSSIL